ncbi:MAG: hypothetical protein M1838_001884 [Thelocarpon superellum]|nr:MAG: hypothetical protein M1838_001884 [Thelocarpon superellum]
MIRPGLVGEPSTPLTVKENASQKRFSQALLPALPNLPTAPVEEAPLADDQAHVDQLVVATSRKGKTTLSIVVPPLDSPLSSPYHLSLPGVINAPDFTDWQGEGDDSSVDNGFSSYTHSKTWISENEKEFVRFVNVRATLQRIGASSDVLPQDFGEWIRHRIEALEDLKSGMRKQIQTIHSVARKTTPMTLPMRGKRFADNRGAVLSMETIWCESSGPSGKVWAPWPSLQEMKWEGEDRAKTNVRRFPPLPREPGNATVAWHQLRAVATLEFDQVRKVPTAEDVQHLMTPQEPLPTWLINDSLWAEIEA